MALNTTFTVSNGAKVHSKGLTIGTQRKELFWISMYLITQPGFKKTNRMGFSWWAMGAHEAMSLSSYVQTSSEVS